jgi:hypothetical protein
VTCPDANPCIVIESPGLPGGSAVVAAATVTADADVFNQTYVVRDAQGDATAYHQPAALSVQGLLRSVGIDPGSVTLLRAWPDDARGETVLTAREHDLDRPAPFTGGVPPLLYVDGRPETGQSIDFIRPTRSATDVNFTDVWQATRVLHLVVSTTGVQVFPSITATVGTGRSVQVGADLDRVPSGTSWTWTFDDGTAPVTTATPSYRHTVGAPGLHGVSVTVNEPDGSYGVASTTFRIGSGAPPPTAAPGTPTGGSAAHGPRTGPDRSRGGTVGAPAGSTGVASGATSGRPTAGDGAGGALASGGRAADVATGAVPVEGLVLSAADVPAASTPVRVATAPAVRAQRGPTPVGWLLGVLVVAGLLVAGARLETRPRRTGAVARSSKVRP